MNYSQMSELELLNASKWASINFPGGEAIGSISGIPSRIFSVPIVTSLNQITLLRVFPQATFQDTSTGAQYYVDHLAQFALLNNYFINQPGFLISPGVLMRPDYNFAGAMGIFANVINKQIEIQVVINGGNIERETGVTIAVGDLVYLGVTIQYLDNQ